MKTEASTDNDFEVDEYDDFQYEVTTDMAHEFVEQAILPMIEEFDYQNPNEDYIPGVATFGLYIKLVERLLEDGFSQDQLKEIINDFSVIDVDGRVH